MIWYQMAPDCAGVPRSARVTASTVSHLIDRGTLLYGEVTLRPARWNRLAGERPRSNADPSELGDARFRLLGLGFVSADQPFDTFVGPGSWLPVPIEVANTRDRIVRPRLRYRQARRLSGSARFA
jgi:hypothetical protein